MIIQIESIDRLSHAHFDDVALASVPRAETRMSVMI